METIKSTLFIVLLASVSLLSLSCSKTNSDDPVINVDSDDKEMNGAIDQARKSVQQFITALQSPRADQSDFSVKKEFPEGNGGGEHIWLTDVTFDGKDFHGKVGNDPEIVKNVKFGDDAIVGKDEISDWMFIENGKLMGGYTLRVLYSRMTPKEKEDFLKEVPFQF